LRSDSSGDGLPATATVRESTYAGVALGGALVGGGLGVAGGRPAGRELPHVGDLVALVVHELRLWLQLEPVGFGPGFA